MEPTGRFNTPIKGGFLTRMNELNYSHPYWTEVTYGLDNMARSLKYTYEDIYIVRNGIIDRYPGFGPNSDFKKLINEWYRWNAGGRRDIWPDFRDTVREAILAQTKEAPIDIYEIIPDP